MMISQSELQANQEVTALAVPLIGDASGGDRDVRRLEFQTLDLSSQTLRMQEKEQNEVPMLPDEKSTQDALTAASNDLALHEQELNAAVQRGRIQGNRETAAELQHQLELHRSQVLTMCGAFRREREEYFRSVEGEVVKLSLAVAKRILHREVMLDPVVLQGVVKVALEKLEDSTGTVLRVPEEDATIWRDLFTSDRTCEVEVRGDHRLGAGECTLETQVGRVELGVGAQLVEIEKGFFDLLQQRPA